MINKFGIKDEKKLSQMETLITTAKCQELEIVCPDGCVIFKLTAKPLGNENFHKGGFWSYPDETV